ncbi:hypothetical protein ACLMJK_002031 [Lecanora helva]
MDEFKARRAIARDEIYTKLDELGSLSAQELDEKVSECCKVFEIEKSAYIREIDTLKNRVGRISELEEQNAKLFAELESAKQTYQQTQPKRDWDTKKRNDSTVNDDSQTQAESIPIEEYNRLKDELARSNNDYGKAIFARQILESKVRHYKDMTKQWREYTDRWILKHPKKPLEARHALKTSHDPVTQDPRSSSAPAPPSIPNGMITPSVSDVSRSASPWIDHEVARKQKEKLRGQQENSPELLSARIFATQRALEQGSGAQSEDLTEASEEVEEPHSVPLEAYGDKPPVKNVEAPPSVQDEDDDLPIFVSERPIKWRRLTSTLQQQEPQNPPIVKKESESKSSSPIHALTTLNGAPPHDSLDLDEVGGHVITPRKRQRLEQMRLRSSMLMAGSESDLGVVPEAEHSSRPLHSCHIKCNYSRGGSTRSHTPFRHSPKPSETGSNHDDAEQDKRLPKISSRAQHQAHNRRVQEKMEAIAQPRANNRELEQFIETRSSHNDTVLPPSSPRPSMNLIPEAGDQSGSHMLRDRRERDDNKPTPATPTVLKPMDPNAHILPRTNEKLPNQGKSVRPGRRDRGAAYVPTLAEDGEDSPAKTHTLGLNTSTFAKESDASSRLKTLMSEPSPAKSLLEKGLLPNSDPKISRSSDTSSVKATRPQSLKTYSTPRRPPAKCSGNGRPDEGNRTNPQQQQHRGDKHSGKGDNQPILPDISQYVRVPSSHKSHPIEPPLDPQPEQEPLRARPLQRLCIDDFKLNPAHSEYAYHESIRKHDEKKSISGCTDRNCLRCKDIRKFVESSGYAHVLGQDTEESDRLLLESYLGPEGFHKIDKMSAEEKKEILIQAKTQQFADKFGKHRTNFGRAMSPVDYWNTDFPTTQEHERNREAARQREREKVEEMYYEAIRKGGRYVFADE